MPVPDNVERRQVHAAGGITPAVSLAVIAGCIVGLFILIRKLPAHQLSRSDIQRLLFYRYLRERGELES